MAFQFNLMGKWVSVPAGLAGALIAVGAHSATPNKFDTDQNERIAAVRSAVTGTDKAATTTLAKDSVTKVDDALSDYESYGPNQRRVASELAATETTEQVIKQVLDSYSSGEGNQVSLVAGPLLADKFGIALKYNTDDKKWQVQLAGNTPAEKAASFDKAKKAIGGQMKPAIWKSLDDETKRAVTNAAIARLGGDLSAVLTTDGVLDSDLKTKLEAKSKELGDDNSGKIQELNKKISTAMVADASEKRLLTAEKKTYQKLADASGDKTQADLCSEFATNFMEGKVQTDVQRRLAAMADDDPCKEPLQKLAKKSGFTADSARKVAAKEESDRVVRLTESEDEIRSRGNNDSLVNPKDKEGESTSESESEGEKSSRETALESQIQQLAGANQQMQAQINQNQIEKAMKACNQSGSLTDKLGLNADNEKNQRVIKSLRDKLEKTISDNMVNLVCQQSGASEGNLSVSRMGDAARSVITGMGVPESGALTAAKVKTLEGISKQATEKAGQLAGGLRTRAQLIRQIDEAAAKRALTRIVTENPRLIPNPQSVNYLTSLSYAELVGQNGTGGALALFLQPGDRDIALKMFNDDFLVAQADMKDENGITDDYANQVECALALASEATQRYAIEAEREDALGLNRGKLRGLAVSSPTSVRNVNTSTRARPL